MGPETGTGQAPRCAGAVYLGRVAAGDAVARMGWLPPTAARRWHRREEGVPGRGASQIPIPCCAPLS